MSTTLNVRGRKIRTASARRYIVVVVRPADVTAAVTGKVYVAFARVEKRTDNIETARASVRRYGRFCGAFAVVIDRLTGQEI